MAERVAKTSTRPFVAASAICDLAYRIQADRFGDLDHETRQLLDRAGAKESGAAISARLVSLDQKRTELKPGTVLVREWDRKSQRVVVMADGFAWNGQTYDSLSKVAFAITGTRWNGPRFFGLEILPNGPTAPSYATNPTTCCQDCCSTMPAIAWSQPTPPKPASAIATMCRRLVLHGEAKTASAGSVSRVPAADIEDIIVKSVKEHLAANQDKSTTSACALRGSRRPRTAGRWDCCAQGQADRSTQIRLTQTKHPIPRMISCSQFPGRNRHPKNPARSCSRIMHLEATSARNSSSAGRAWSAPSPEVVGGWMMLSQVE